MKKTQGSEIYYLNIKDSKTGLVFSVPCNSKSISEDLEEYFDDVFSPTREISEVGGHTFQEIYWSYDQDGQLLGSLVPADQASDDIVDHYNLTKKGMNNLDLCKDSRRQTFEQKVTLKRNTFNKNQEGG